MLTALAGVGLVVALAVPAMAADGRTQPFGKGGKSGHHRVDHGGRRWHHNGWGHGRSHRRSFFYGFPFYYGGYNGRSVYGYPQYPYPYGYPGFRDDATYGGGEPVPDSARASAPDAGAAPAPGAEPAPAPGAEPAPAPGAEPAPAPGAEPAPDPGAEPAPDPGAEPAPDPDAKPAPDAKPDPDAKPAPDEKKEEPSSDSSGEATAPAGPAGDAPYQKKKDDK